MASIFAEGSSGPGSSEMTWERGPSSSTPPWFTTHLPSLPYCASLTACGPETHIHICARTPAHTYRDPLKATTLILRQRLRIDSRPDMMPGPHIQNHIGSSHPAMEEGDSSARVTEAGRREERSESGPGGR